MIPGQRLLDQVRERFPTATITHESPFVRVEIIDGAFTGIAPERREEVLAQRAGVPADALRATAQRTFLRFDLFAPGELPLPRHLPRGESWLGLVARGYPEADPQAAGGLRAVHFYGFKGGQGRSSLLAYLGLALAADGWRVLAVDVDAEAPSLDRVLGYDSRQQEATLVGARAGLQLRPARVWTPPRGGALDIIAFRPMDPIFDLDAAALAFEAASYSPGQQALARATADVGATYDCVLIDHRTGIAPSVPPWVTELKGPVVVCARMDGQSQQAIPMVSRLWQPGGSPPGVVVSLTPAGVAPEQHRAAQQERGRAWLDALAAVAFPNEAGRSGDELADHWIVWPHDTTFEDGSVPTWGQSSPATTAVIGELRRVLLLTGQRAAPRPLASSGAVDGGYFIQTQAVRDLSAQNCPYRLIVGRKGTGKTRLVRELVERGLGRPLLVAQDAQETLGGVPAGTGRLETLVKATDNQPEDFWWCLLAAAIEVGTAREALQARLDELAQAPGQGLRRLRAGVRASPQERRVLLIDGLETAFPRRSQHAYVGELLRILQIVETDSELAGQLELRVFLRTDVMRLGFQNLEQFSERRVLNLQWDTQRILNFALSRIVSLPWFKENFVQAVAGVEGDLPQILTGELGLADCEVHLLRFFPDRLRRLNLNMTTFLRTYFGDETDGEISYYPRVFDHFLRVIGEPMRRREVREQDVLVGGRIGEVLINHAHKQATEEFLDQVRQELIHLVRLNQEEVKRLIDAFRDTITPFRLDQRVEEVAQKADLNQRDVREALDGMRSLGIFEERQGYEGQWRAGRLFKTSLGMLYDRRRGKAEASVRA